MHCSTKQTVFALRNVYKRKAIVNGHPKIISHRHNLHAIYGHQQLPSVAVGRLPPSTDCICKLGNSMYQKSAILFLWGVYDSMATPLCRLLPLDVVHHISLVNHQSINHISLVLYPQVKMLSCVTVDQHDHHQRMWWSMLLAWSLLTGNYRRFYPTPFWPYPCWPENISSST